MSDLQDRANSSVNDSGTSAKIDTPVTQRGSRHVLASHRPKKRGSVYFIRAGDKIKIGFSTSPTKRLKVLQTSHPGKLDLVGSIPGSYQTETRLHRLFRRLKVKGEWFRADKPLLEFIERSTPEGRAAQEARNKARLRWGPPPARLPVDPALPALLETLARRHPHLPEVAKGHASNVREQIRNFIHGDEEQRKLLMPYMAASMALLEKHSAR